ncbi:terminase small subunit [Thalassovita sp.]|uniref:terminase small subunit n=1 Tax=Thalassovita sp. TaxID=1979401 RepID=UPI002B278D2A|nr:terminase small subunit [Thalassovita sp.]
MSSQADTTTSTEWLDQFDLSDRQRDFVLAYLKDPNAKQAAIEAGYSPKTAKQQGSRLLTNVDLQRAIARGRKEAEKAAMLSVEDVAVRWAKIATVDATELVEHRIGACRYCHGIDNDFQWKTEREFREALQSVAYELFAEDDLRAAAIARTIIDHRLPNDLGGYGYRITVDPNPDCPECSGLGVEYTRIADTRTMSPEARILFDGIEETRQGKKIKLQDRSKALDSLAKHLGMFAGKVDPEDTDPLTVLAQRIMGNAAAVPVRPDPEPSQGAIPHPLDAASAGPTPEVKTTKRAT